MKICRLLHPPGETITLTLLPLFDDTFEKRLQFNIVEALIALAPVVQPIAARLHIVCREFNTSFIEPDMFPERAYWWLHEANLPSYITLNTPVDPLLQRVSVALLDPMTIDVWLNKALTQDAPTQYNKVTFGSLVCTSTRVRLSHVINEEAFQLRDSNQILNIPIERRAGGEWVAAPINDWYIYPAVAFEIANYNGALELKIWISWSDWAERGTNEHAALQQSLYSLVDLGWRPEIVPPSFKFNDIV